MKKSFDEDDEDGMASRAPAKELELKTKAELGSSQPIPWEASPDRYVNLSYVVPMMVWGGE